MNQKTYLSDDQLAKRYNISRVSVWRWSKNAPHFPKPVRLSPGCTRWLLNEIEAWEKLCTKKQRGAQ